MIHQKLLETLLSQLDSLEDSRVSNITYGDHVVAVESRSMGLATWAWSHHPVPLENLPDPDTPVSVKELASLILDDSPLKASLGMAALNSLLPDIPEHLITDINAGDLILNLGKNKRVAVIGHFPFVGQMKDAFKELMVFEKKPHPGDLAESSIPALLPGADIVAITATTLANKTLATVLSHCSESAVKLMVGPSTPLCPKLLDMGFDYAAGSLVTDREKVIASIRKGVSFKYVKGVRHIIIESSASGRSW